MTQPVMEVPPREGPAAALPAKAHGRRAQTIQRTLMILARAVGRKLNVEVRVGGTEAKTDGECRPEPDVAFDADPAMMQVDKTLDQSQADSGAGLPPRGRRIHLIEALKYVRQVIRRNSGAVVAHAKPGPALVV